jgi:hypothetical protein
MPENSLAPDSPTLTPPAAFSPLAADGPPPFIVKADPDDPSAATSLFADLPPSSYNDVNADAEGSGVFGAGAEEGEDEKMFKPALELTYAGSSTHPFYVSRLIATPILPVSLSPRATSRLYRLSFFLLLTFARLSIQAFQSTANNFA